MKYRILIADDEQLERRALSRILSELKGREIDLVEAANGRQAVEVAASNSIDLAFLDIRMPGMDGLQAARAIRELSPDIHIVFVTAFDKFDYAREALRLGVDEYLVKPAAADEVRAMARRILERIEKDRIINVPGSGPENRQALILLEEELRSDLDRDGMDSRRLETFLRLNGLENRAVTSLILRPTGALPPDPEVRRVHARRILERTEQTLRRDGWYTLAGIDETELRCVAAPLSQTHETEGTLTAALKRTLENLASDLFSSLGLRILAGACPSAGSNPFRWARNAAALARIDRPVVVLASADLQHGPAESGGEGAGNAVIERALSFMKAHLAEDLSLADVAGAAGTAPTHLSRLFRRHRGETFVQAFCRLRTDAAKRLLRTGQYRIKEVCGLVGFKDTAYFCRVFRKYEGVSPASFQAGSR